MDPTPILLLVAIVLLAGAAIAQAKYVDSHRPTRITGWWHYQHPDDGKRNWNPDAWGVACDASLRKSHQRRELDD